MKGVVAEALRATAARGVQRVAGSVSGSHNLPTSSVGRLWRRAVGVEASEWAADESLGLWRTECAADGQADGAEAASWASFADSGGNSITFDVRLKNLLNRKNSIFLSYLLTPVEERRLLASNLVFNFIGIVRLRCKPG